MLGAIILLPALAAWFVKPTVVAPVPGPVPPAAP
jgi:hypothetical protein